MQLAVENVVFETIRSEMMETKRLKKRYRPNTPHLKAYVDNDDSNSSDDDSKRRKSTLAILHMRGLETPR